MLLAQALSRLRSGDILMAHLGIWSRKDPFAPVLDPLIAGLRILNHLTYWLIPLFIGCAVAGQLVGGRLRRARRAGG